MCQSLGSCGSVRRRDSCLRALANRDRQGFARAMLASQGAGGPPPARRPFAERGGPGSRRSQQARKGGGKTTAACSDPGAGHRRALNAKP